MRGAIYLRDCKRRNFRRHSRQAVLYLLTDGLFSFTYHFAQEFDK